MIANGPVECRLEQRELRGVVWSQLGGHFKYYCELHLIT